MIPLPRTIVVCVLQILIANNFAHALPCYVLSLQNMPCCTATQMLLPAHRPNSEDNSAHLPKLCCVTGDAIRPVLQGNCFQGRLQEHRPVHSEVAAQAALLVLITPACWTFRRSEDSAPLNLLPSCAARVLSTRALLSVHLACAQQQLLISVS